jgi:hypothetical protein
VRLTWLVALLFAAGGLSVAYGAGPEVWASMHDARLTEALDRDPAAALAVYEAVLTHLPEADALRANALLWLGSARYDAGDVVGAREALAGAAEDATQRLSARMMRAYVDAEQRQVVELPLATGFDGDVAPFARGWLRGSPDDLAIADLGRDDDASLIWTTEVRDGESDFIFARLTASTGTMVEARLRLRAREFPMHLRVLLEDESGERWTAPVMIVGTTDWSEVAVRIGDFAPASAPAADRRADPSAVRVMVVQDVTSYHSETRGYNALYIDELRLR